VTRQIEPDGTRGQLLSPRLAYDRIATQYQSWRWYRFWRLNEAPIVTDWLQSLPRGYGLDAGSGTGPYLHFVSDLGHRCVALDLSLQMLKLDRRDHRPGDVRSAVHYVQGDVTILPFAGEAFDWILCTRVLSHIPGLEDAVLELGRVLKPGGECLIADVHPDHPYDHVTIPCNGTPVPIETHKHSFDELRTWLGMSGLRLESHKNYWLDDLAVRPPKAEFAKLYDHADQPIFYVCRLLKNEQRPS